MGFDPPVWLQPGDVMELGDGERFCVDHLGPTERGVDLDFVMEWSGKVSRESH
jgi:hypothetical protein